MSPVGKPPPHPATPDQVIDLLYRPDGCKKLRPVHAIGIAASGYFQPSAVALLYSKAAHFQPKRDGHPIKVRFSNGSGCKDPHDAWSDVRGMAVRFSLPRIPEEAELFTDLIAMTLPEFFSSTPDEFQDFAWAAQPEPYLAASPLRKLWDLMCLKPPMRDPYPGETISPDPGAIRFADAHDVAKPGVVEAATIGAPVSYLRAAYHAVHTFVVTNAEGVQRWVRFSWQPVLGVKNLPLLAPYTPAPELGNGDQYLQDELRGALIDSNGKDHPRFSLMMTIGEVSDDLNNPARAWPPHRIRVMMGTLSIKNILNSQTDGENMSFNPGLLTDGIALSDDLVLKFRVETYKRSSALRNATPCPFREA